MRHQSYLWLGNDNVNVMKLESATHYSIYIYIYMRMFCSSLIIFSFWESILSEMIAKVLVGHCYGIPGGCKHVVNYA